MEQTKDDIDIFLEKLNELTAQHKIRIWGCGCCGSPSLIRLGSYKDIAVNLTYNDGKYTIDKGV